MGNVKRTEPLLTLLATPTVIFNEGEGQKDSYSQDWHF